MDFDIFQLDGVDIESREAEAAFDAYQQAIVDRFVESPEGQERLKADRNMGYWAANLMYYGWNYEGASLPRMTVGDVRSVVADLFPRKISLRSPEEADDGIPALTAFWTFLKREFQLPQADAILEFLRELEPHFHEMMNDPSNFDIAKSLFMMGHAAGFDMNTQEGANAFMLAYNAGILAKRSSPISSFFDPPERVDPAKRKADRKKRKQAAEARWRNRKRKT